MELYFIYIAKYNFTKGKHFWFGRYILQSEINRNNISSGKHLRRFMFWRVLRRNLK